MVYLHVGPNRKAYAVHEKLISTRSVFFAKSFKESGNSTIVLPTDDPKVFDSLIDYIYRGTSPVPQHAKTSVDDEDFIEYRMHMFKVFALAEKYCMNDFANIVLDEIQDRELAANLVCSEDEIQFIYGITLKNSKLRLYVAASMVYKSNLAQQTTNEHSHNLTHLGSEIPNFAVDYLHIHAKHGATIGPDNLDPQIRSKRKGLGHCYFHTHADGEVCHLGEMVEGESDEDGDDDDEKVEDDGDGENDEEIDDDDEESDDDDEEEEDDDDDDEMSDQDSSGKQLLGRSIERS
jgi:hypothetical protein